MKIGVIGSINMDKVASVDHIPLKGETLLAKSYMETFGGKGANQCVAVARLGGDITMFGCVGNDGDGQKVLVHMKDVGVHTDHIKIIDDVATGCAFINVGEGDNAIVVVQGANNYVTKAYVMDQGEALADMDIILIQNEIPTETIEFVLESYGGGDQLIIYNPAPYKSIQGDLLSKATYITPNEHEVIELQKESQGNYPKASLIITRGAMGSDFYNGTTWQNVPAIECMPIDTTGAGDTFNGALAYGLSQEMSLEEAVRFANTAAGIATEKEGAQLGMPSLGLVEARL